MTEKTVVLGGGAAGVSLSATLARNTQSEVHLFEKRGRLGGLQHSVTVGERSYDIGLFRFSHSHDLVQCFPGLRDILTPIDKHTRVLMESSNTYPHPPDHRMLLSEQGWVGGLRALLSVAQDRLRFYGLKDVDVKSYARYHMGGYFYRKSGLKWYIQRLYRMSDGAVGTKFARQRLPNLDVRSIGKKIASSFPSIGSTTNDDNDGEERAKTLRTPPEGFDPVYGHVETILREQGVRLNLSTQVEKIRRDQEKFVVESSSGTVRADHVFSTIPIPVALYLIGEEPKIEVGTISLYSVFFRAPFSGGWTALYNHTDSGKWKRIFNHGPTEPTNRSKPHFTAEITVRDPDENSKDAYWEEVSSHLRSHGIFEGSLERTGFEVTPNAYPVFEVGQEKEVRREIERLKSFGITPVGRQAQHDYLHSSSTSERAQRIARKVMEASV